MGNIYDGIDESMMKFFREDTFCNHLRFCKDCWAKHYCGGTCTYVSALTCGHYDIPYAPDCELTKYLIELAGYIVVKLRTRYPNILPQVIALRDIVPMARRPEAFCHLTTHRNFWTCPVEDWRVPDPIVLTDREHVGGCKQSPISSKCSATIHLRWDKRFLYLIAEVNDPIFTPAVTAESEWWFRDSIQFALDPEKDGGEGKYPWQLPQGDYEFGITVADGRTYMYDCQIDLLSPITYGDASVIREGSITTYRVAIPWNRISGFIPSVGAECRFSVVINDCDNGVRGWLQWTHGLATRKAPARFGLLRLVE